MNKMTIQNPRLYGPLTSEDLRKYIERDGLKPANMQDTAHLISTAFCSDDIPHSKRIRGVMKTSWFNAYTRRRPEQQGVFVYEEDERFGDLTGNQLEQELSSFERNGVTYSEDGALRFVPFGYATGEMSPAELANNPLLIALTKGEEVAEEVARFAGMHKNKSYLNPYPENSTGVSVLNSFRFFSLRSLTITGDIGWGGYAFGLERSDQ